MTKSKITALALTLFSALTVFLMAASVLADDGTTGGSTRNTQVGADMWTNKEHFAPGDDHARHSRVRCDRGDSLSKALRRARPHDTIRFFGTCYETIVVTTSDLTLQGANGATIDGSQTPSEAVVLIDSAHNLKFEGFTVQNGSDQGVLLTRQSQAILTGLSIRNNGTVGLSVDRSHIEIVDLVLDDNNTGGMDAYSGSTVVAKGLLSASRNGGDGIAVNGKTFLELRGANVTASQNAGSGVSIINDSRLQIFSFPEAQGSSIDADNNGFAGIGILGSELGVVGSQYFGSGANVISARNNNVFGFFAPSGAILSPHATAKFVASGNGVGLLLEDGGSALIIGGLDLTQNGAGLSAHGAGTLTLVSVPPNPSQIDNNHIDLDLGFGTRLTSDNVTFTSIACDETVLTRGLSCP